MPLSLAILISAVIACLYAAALYARNPKDELAKGWRIALAVLRSAFVFAVCLLLFAPTFKVSREEERKPLCFIAVDGSQSMKGLLPAPDSARLIALEKKLRKDFDVVSVPFGGAGTDYEQVFGEIKNKAAGSTNACVVLVSDGNPNIGQEPVQAYRSCAFPLFTVALGDTALYPDLFIGQVQHNAYAYKGNSFPVRVQIGRNLIDKGSVKLRLSQDGKTLREEAVNLEKPSEIEWEIEAEEAGVFRYSLALEGLKGERNLKNNRADFSVRVLESKRKIVILGAVPHPDLSALNRSLSKDGKYEVSVYTPDNRKNAGYRKELEEADVIILHGLPSLNENLSSLAEPLSRKPLWYIVTPSTHLKLLNDAKTGLTVIPQGNSWNEAQAIPHPSFARFEMKAAEKAAYEKFPPLYAPFAKYECTGGEVVFFQNILQTPTSEPLVYLNAEGAYPVVVFTGQGLWRWHLADYRQNGSTEIFDRLIDRFIQLLSTGKPKENLVIRCPQTLSATEALTVRAELYNASFEKVAGQEISFLLRNGETGQEYAFEFEPDGDFYRLYAGVLPEGGYTFTASCRLGSEKYTARGRIWVAAFNPENPDMPANAALLRNLALTYGGEFFYAGTATRPYTGVWQDVYNALKSRKDLKPQLRAKETYISLLDRAALAITLLGLLCLEFLLRKIFGNL